MSKEKIQLQTTKETSTIDKMVEASFPVIPFSFNGITVYCKVRCLNRTQLRAIGEFNLIDTRRIEEIQERGTLENLQDMIDMINWQESLVKETLIEPTFEEIESKVYGKDNKITSLKERLEKIRSLINKAEPSERAQLNKEADALELYIGSLLPNDFMNEVTSWATGVNRSDIKRLTRDMLLESAILAKRGSDNPADHLDGEFLDMHRDEINKAAWIIYNQYEEDQEKERAMEKTFKGMKIIRGGRKVQ